MVLKPGISKFLTRKNKNKEGNWKNLLFGGRAILSATEAEDFTAIGESDGVKHDGHPFSTRGPHISPSAVS